MRVTRPLCIAATSLVVAHAASAQVSGYVTTSDSARIYYQIAGRAAPGRDTIIAIHGGPGMDLESIYGDFAPKLGKSHVVIFYDQRGGGRSDLPADTSRLVAARQVRDLDELRQHFGLKQVALVAHSYGPLLAASYAIAHPGNVKRMVFFGPVPPRRGDFFTRYSANINKRLTTEQRADMLVASRRQNADTVSERDARQACREYWANGLRPRLADPENGGVVKSDLCASDIKGIRYGSRTGNGAIMGSFGDWDLRPALAALHIPLLVVHGEQETIPMDLVAEWVSAMPKGMATLMKVPQAAHFAYAEQGGVVWPAVERFLAGRRP